MDRDDQMLYDMVESENFANTFAIGFSMEEVVSTCFTDSEWVAKFDDPSHPYTQSQKQYFAKIIGYLCLKHGDAMDKLPAGTKKSNWGHVRIGTRVFGIHYIQPRTGAHSTFEFSFRYQSMRKSKHVSFH
jgi:hypothetical protein